jgi:predicted acyltransferase (DUF342 family)
MYQIVPPAVRRDDAASRFLSANAVTDVTPTNEPLVHAMTGLLRLGLDVDVAYPLRELVEFAARHGENTADLLAAAEYAVVDELMDLQADVLHGKMRRLAGFVTNALRGVAEHVPHATQVAI